MSFDIAALHPAADDNKYTRGKLVVVAGSARYPGAAVLAARAGQRMGAGYTEVVTAREAIDVVRIASPSLVVRPLDEWQPKDLPSSSEDKPLAVCIGLGFRDNILALIVPSLVSVWNIILVKGFVAGIPI